MKSYKAFRINIMFNMMVITIILDMKRGKSMPSIVGKKDHWMGMKKSLWMRMNWQRGLIILPLEA